jgi:hypothetical protein
MAKAVDKIVTLHEEARALEMAIFHEKAEDLKAKYQKRLDRWATRFTTCRPLF